MSDNIEDGSGVALYPVRYILAIIKKSESLQNEVNQLTQILKDVGKWVADKEASDLNRGVKKSEADTSSVAVQNNITRTNDKEESEKPQQQKKEISLVRLKAAVTDYLNKNGGYVNAAPILQEKFRYFGISTLSELPVKDYQGLLDLLGYGE